MRVRSVLMVLLLVPVVASMGCGGSDAPDPSSTSASSGTQRPTTTADSPDVTVAGPGPVTLSVGGRATLVLDANPTTGYSWELTSPPDTAVVRIASDTYVPPARQVPGAGGTQEIRVEGVAPGSTRLTFGYRRPWETGVPPVETATFDVTVS